MKNVFFLLMSLPVLVHLEFSLNAPVATMQNIVFFPTGTQPRAILSFYMAPLRSQTILSQLLYLVTGACNMFLAVILAVWS